MNLIFREGILIIQNNIRYFIETSKWSWYRLLLIVKELIPLNKDKVKLEELSKTNNELTKVRLIDIIFCS